ncbi:MAG TPA: hypothetical protein VIU93_09410 [Gallionellaceae bacterium]
MNAVQIVIPELFLPPELMQAAAADLQLPALLQLLARSEREPLQDATLEGWLARMLGVAEGGLAPYCLQAEGIAPGSSYCLRADPVHLRLQGNQMQVRADVLPSAAEAGALCDSLNTHFAAAGLHFSAPHPQRWYVQVDHAPALRTTPLTQVVGEDAQAHLPSGADALHWHGVMNEIQMLLFEHAVNQAREARGELSVNSVWLWGGGVAAQALPQPFACVISDGELALLLARAAGMQELGLPAEQPFPVAQVRGEVLLVWAGLQTALLHGDLASWRSELLRFEQQCMAPLLVMLKAGRIGRIVLDVPGATASRHVLPRAATWKLWRFARPLAYYAMN